MLLRMRNDIRGWDGIGRESIMVVGGLGPPLRVVQMKGAVGK